MSGIMVRAGASLRRRGRSNCASRLVLTGVCIFWPRFHALGIKRLKAHNRYRRSHVRGSARVSALSFGPGAVGIEPQEAWHVGPNSGRARSGGCEHRGSKLQAGTPNQAATPVGGPGRPPVDTGTSATLQPIANVTVPSQQGTTIPLLAASGATDPQTYTVTSSNPNIAASDRPGTILDPRRLVHRPHELRQ